MTTQENKIENRNQLLLTFNPSAINVESLNLGLSMTRNFKKKTVRIVDGGFVNTYQVKMKVINNQGIFYIIK
jgi:hypothetical protein